MAIVKNIKITSAAHLSNALDYVLRSKETSHGGFEHAENAVDYIIDDREGGATSAFYNIPLNHQEDPAAFFKSFIKTSQKSREARGKATQAKNGEEPVCWHYIQNFGVKIDESKAHEIAEKVMDRFFKNFPVVVGVHQNTGFTHIHYDVCAYGYDGKKWNQNNKVYGEIRAYSDELCREHGLPVLDSTKDMKVTKFYDRETWERMKEIKAKGSSATAKEKEELARLKKKVPIAQMEVTERKKELLRKRSEGKKTTDSIGSYRDTEAFEKAVDAKDAATSAVRKDIDELLPTVRSFDELLEKLIGKGYKIKDRKKGGGYLKYVSYQPPTHEKPTRETRLGDAYLRENLMDLIEKQNAERQHGEDAAATSPTVLYPAEEYEIGKTDVVALDDNFRLAANGDGTYFTHRRTDAETVTVRHAKSLCVELKDGFDVAAIERAVIIHQKAKRHAKPIPTQARQDKLTAQISENLGNLYFIEQRGILSLSDAEQRLTAVRITLEDVEDALQKIDVLIGKFEEIAVLPEKIKDMEERIEKGRGDAPYDKDVSLLSSLKAQSASIGIDKGEKMEEVRTGLSAAKAERQNILSKLPFVKSELAKHETCFRVLQRAAKITVDKGKFEQNRKEAQRKQKEERERTSRRVYTRGERSR